MEINLKKLVAFGIIGIVLLIIIFNCFATVPVNHTGVWKRLGVVQEKAVPEGIHVKIPFVDSIESISNQIQTVSIISSQSNKAATTTETAETKDQQLIMEYTFDIQYQLDKEKSFVIYQNYGKEYEKMLVINNVIPIIKQAFTLYESEELVNHKNDISDYVYRELHEFTQEFGINILRVNFMSYDFTAEYDAILEERATLKAQVVNEQLRQDQERVAAQTAYDVAVKKAEQDAETARIAADNAKQVALVKAEQDKETAIIQANAKAEAAKINADNDAYVKITVADADKKARLASAEATKAELEAQASGLNELVIQRDFIQKWNGQMIPNIGGSNGFTFMNLNELIDKFMEGGSVDPS